MNGKQFILVLVVLAALVAGGWGVMKWQRGSYEVADARVGQKLLPGFKVDEVAEIAIVEPGATLTLARTDKGGRSGTRRPSGQRRGDPRPVKLEALKAPRPRASPTRCGRACSLRRPAAPRS
jgi:hypothetical protein